MGSEKVECDTLVKYLEEICRVLESQSKYNALRKLFEYVVVSDDFDYVR